MREPLLMRLGGAAIFKMAVIAAIVLGGVTPCAGDQILLKSGRSYDEVTITKATWEQVEYRMRGVSTRQKVDADDVDRLEFTSEPSGLSRGRGALVQGDWARAVSSLRAASSLPDERQKANAMYLLSVAHLRWGEQDGAHLGDAAKSAQEFISRFAEKKDFYLPHAHQILSEALMRSGKFSEAEGALQKLADGTYGNRWVLGGKLGRGEVLLAQGRHADARDLFGSVGNDGAVAGDSTFRNRAWLGYAACQIGQKQYPAAIETVRKKIIEARKRGTPRLDGDMARAWIIWGRAEEERAGGDRKKLQWATIRFLRAAVIATGGDGEALAEALYRAKETWKKLGDTERAEEMGQRLAQLCPNSPWNK